MPRIGEIYNWISQIFTVVYFSAAAASCKSCVFMSLPGMSDGSQAWPSPASQPGLFLQGQRGRGGEGGGEGGGERGRRKRKGGKEERRKKAHTLKKRDVFYSRLLYCSPFFPWYKRDRGHCVSLFCYVMLCYVMLCYGYILLMPFRELCDLLEYVMP